MTAGYGIGGLVCVGLLACGGASAESTPVAPVAEPATVASPNPTQAPEPAATREREPWYAPLPPLTLDNPTDAQKELVRACMDRNRVSAADVSAAELLSAAQCMRDIPLPGHEIRLYKHLLTHHPEAPEAKDAARAVGMRYEQIDVRDQAVDAYVWYLRRWPAEPDARGLGQRAVCLARSLGHADRAEDLLQELERLYGRKGFSRPSVDALAGLCAALAPPQTETANPGHPTG